VQFIAIDSSLLNAIAKSLGIQAATMDVLELGKLAPYIVRTEWKRVKFFTNMVAGLLMGRFKHPSLCY
jgi:hypothetical protein